MRPGVVLAQPTPLPAPAEAQLGLLDRLGLRVVRLVSG